MTIDEAIKHCLEVAEKNDDEAEVYDLLAKNHNNPYEKLTASRFYTDCAECAADHRQLAEWLTDYKELKNTIGAVKLSNMKEALELIRKYKAENSNLKAFITSIYQILGEHFEYPCSNEVVAELMKERSTCFDCGGKINNEECWRRYFTTMIGEDEDENS